MRADGGGGEGDHVTETPAPSASQAPIDLWLKRVFVLVLIIFLSVSSFYVWRIAMVFYRVEKAVETVSSDVGEVTGAAARISRKMEELIDRIERLEKKTGKVVTLDEVETVLDSVADLKSGAGEKMPADAAAEIGRLFALIRSSGREYEYAGKIKSPLKFYGHVYAKYKAYRNAITSAEVFIDKCATKTITGKVYYLRTPKPGGGGAPEGDGGEVTKRPVAEWLREELGKIRAERK